MDQVRRYFLIPALLAAPVVAAPRFYADDPLRREPPPRQVGKIQPQQINAYVDFARNTFFEPGGDLRKAGRVPPAAGVNTLGEVPDNAWYRDRHPERMSLAELAGWPAAADAPSAREPWLVLSGKSEGVTSGMMIRDSRGKKYLLKLDPPCCMEMASAADVISAKFFHALGYNVPENFIARFTGAQLRVGPESKFTGKRGNVRAMQQADLDYILSQAPRDSQGRYRGVASAIVPGELVGPFRYDGTRPDDPNDIVPHENRRDLRGLYVFAAWLNHTDIKASNSLDTVVEENGRRFVRHYLIDFGASLGSDSIRPKIPSGGYQYMVDTKAAGAQLATLGFYVPAWQRARYPRIAGTGRFGWEAFDPRRWRSNYPNPAIDSCMPDDAFWAAVKVMAFTDERIRTLVAAGEFSDPQAARWMALCLIERRNKIGRAFFEDVLPLDNFQVRGGELRFDDLAVERGHHPAREYAVRWFRFDNGSERLLPVAGGSLAVPRQLAGAEYAAAMIHAEDARKSVTVYLRDPGGKAQVVGITRQPGRGVYSR